MPECISMLGLNSRLFHGCHRMLLLLQPMLEHKQWDEVERREPSPYWRLFGGHGILRGKIWGYFGTIKYELVDDVADWRNSVKDTTYSTSWLSYLPTWCGDYATPARSNLRWAGYLSLHLFRNDWSSQNSKYIVFDWDTLVQKWWEKNSSRKFIFKESFQVSCR